MADLLGIFGFLVVLLRAATLCFQTILAGGVIFLAFVASNNELRPEELTRPAWRFIRCSGVGLALCQIAFLIVNSLVLGNSTEISIREMLGANFAIAGIVAIVSSLAIALWPARLQKSVNRSVLVPAMLILASSVVTSHSFSRMEGRAVLVGLTSLHYLATASWIGGLPYLLLSMKRISDQGIRMRISQRFSRLAQISVAVLFLAGLGMSLGLVERALRHGVRHHGGNQSGFVRLPAASRRGELFHRARNRRGFHHRVHQPDPLRRSGNRHRPDRDSGGGLLDVPAARRRPDRGSREPARNCCPLRSSHATLHQSAVGRSFTGQQGNGAKGETRRRESARRIHAGRKLLSSGYAGRHRLVGIQPQLGGPYRLSHGTAGAAFPQ